MMIEKKVRPVHGMFEANVNYDDVLERKLH